MIKPIGPRHTLIGPRTEAGHYKVSLETKEKLHSLARQAEMSPAAFVATLIELRCHGVAVVRRMHEASLEVVSGEYSVERKNVDEK